MLPIENVCRHCRDEKGIDRAIFRIVGGIPLCGGCTADMPQWCTNHLALDPPQYWQAVATRGDKKLCKECLAKECPEPQHNGPPVIGGDGRFRKDPVTAALESEGMKLIENGRGSVTRIVNDSGKEVGKEHVAKTRTVRARPPKAEKKENTMPKPANVDWGEAQRMRNDGATVTEIAEKFGVSNPTVCQHTVARPGKKSQRMEDRQKFPIQKRPSAPAPQRAGLIHTRTRNIIAGDMTPGEEKQVLQQALSILKRRRDGLDQAIESIEAL